MTELWLPGGIFDPFGFSKGDKKVAATIIPVLHACAVTH